MISDVLSYEQPQPYIVENTEYTAEGIPVLTANKAFVLGYTSETNGIYDKGDCIIFDDFTLDCKYVDFPYKIKSSAIKILTAKNKELLRYTFEFLKYLDLSTEEHKRHYIAETQNQEFILPTEQIVKTIAHIFSTLSVRMETAVKQRNSETRIRINQNLLAVLAADVRKLFDVLILMHDETVEVDARTGDPVVVTALRKFASERIDNRTAGVLDRTDEK